MLVHRRVTHSIKFAGTHLYAWVEKGNVRVKCLAQEHNTMSPTRARTRTARSGVQHTNHEATAPPKGMEGSRQKLAFVFHHNEVHTRGNISGRFQARTMLKKNNKGSVSVSCCFSQCTPKRWLEAEKKFFLLEDPKCYQKLQFESHRKREEEQPQPLFNVSSCSFVSLT